MNPLNAIAAESSNRRLYQFKIVQPPVMLFPTMPTWNSAAASWLLLDALVPLLGAAALFWLWGICRFLAADRNKAFEYSWKEAVDPMGWLYGASIRAIQSGTRASRSSNFSLNVYLYICAGVSLILLLAAMTNRGDNPAWKPKMSFQIVVVVFILAILAGGYAAHFPSSYEDKSAAASMGGIKRD